MSAIHIFYLILIQSILVHSELFTSTTHLTHLLNTEIELSRQLESYLKEEYERLDRIEKYFHLFFKIQKFIFFFAKKRFVDIIKDEIRQAQGKEDYYFGNPVNAYLFIKHLTVDWYAIEEIAAPGKLVFNSKHIS
jgi:hypothetical protein